MASTNDSLSLSPAEQAQLAAGLKDPRWRIRHLYWIINKDGREVRFEPWPEQERLLGNLWYRNLILKARQRGFSTVIQLVMLDTCLFVPNTAASVIAQDKDTATGIFRKIRFAYDHLPQPLREANPLTKESETELIFSNGSGLKVATSARGGTLQWLHVSEFGKICAQYPGKAHEIVSGALPAVDQNGIICIESTAEGREGAFFDMCQRAIALRDQGKPLSKLDYRFHFASWWDAPEYELDPDAVVIGPADHAYFAKLEAELGITIGPRKRAWYIAKRDSEFSGDRETMHREYPSTAEEAFAQSAEGVYLADQLTLARQQGRIGTVPHDPGRPVNTFWDLHHGGNDAVSIWFHQRVGLRDHFIRFLEGSGEPYSTYVRTMQSYGYVWGTHYLPHDADRRFPGTETNPTIKDILEQLGLRNTVVVPRTADLTAAIQMLRDDFSSYWFDEANCAAGLRHLSLYRKEWNDRLGVWKETPRHDGHESAADALRQKAQGYQPPVTTKPYRRRVRTAMTA